MGETLPQTALWEIAEETGINGKIQELLGTVHYKYYDPLRGSIDKSVTYEATSGTTCPQLEEIRAVKWYSLDQASTVYQQQGYDTNRQIFGKALKYSIKGRELSMVICIDRLGQTITKDEAATYVGLDPKLAPMCPGATTFNPTVTCRA